MISFFKPSNNNFKVKINNLIKPSKKASIGQGTIEYLVILAVIVVVGLIVVGLASGFLDSSSQVITNTQGISTATSTGIVVREAILDTDGNAILSLQNNTGEEITLTKITIDGIDLNYNNKILPTNRLFFSLPNTNCSCLAGEKTKSCLYELYYTTRYGIEKKETIEVNLECVSTSQSNVATISPISQVDEEEIVQLQCEENEFEYNGECYSICVNNEVFFAGNGTQENPYAICSWEQLNEIRNYSSDNFILIKNLNENDAGYNTYASGTANSGNGWIPIEIFSGIFDGNNKTISDIIIYHYEGDYQIGFFENLSDANIINLNLEGNYSGYCKDGYAFGGIAAKGNGNIINVTFSGSLNSDNEVVGGLVGQFSGIIENSSNTATIDSLSYGVGGLVGEFSGTITNSYSNGTINGADTVGGLVGQIYEGTITSSYNNGAINGSSEWAQGIGGIAGFNSGAISSSHNTGDITSSGIFGVGGIAGSNSGSVNNVYNTGNVYALNSDNVGGIVGYNDSVDLNETYNTGNVTGKNYVGGLIGLAQSQIYINTSYNSGSINASNYAAGFIAMGGDTIIHNSYNSGNISGDSGVTGFISDAGHIEIINSYNSGSVSSSYSLVGFIYGGNPLIKNSFNVGAATGSPNYFIYYYSGTLENNFTNTTNCVEAGETYDASECAVNQTATDFYSVLHQVYNGNPAWDFTNTWTAVENGYPILKWTTE